MVNHEQDNLREALKESKWRYNKSYKQAADYLGMNYNSLMNWLHQKNINLGYSKRKKLEEYIKAAARSSES